MTRRRSVSVRIDNFDVYVNGRRVEEPHRRVAIMVPSFIVGILFGLFVVFVVLPLVGLGIALILGLAALLVAAVAVFFLFSPILIPALVAIGLFRWLLKD